LFIINLINAEMYTICISYSISWLGL